MTAIPIKGYELAILIVVVGFLGVPAAYALVSWLALPAGDAAYISQLVSMGVELLAIATIPVFRNRAVELLQVPIPRLRLAEVAAVSVVVMIAQFALFGAYALAHWVQGGDEAVKQMALNPARGADAAFAPETLRNLAITCMLAPVVEEIVFRGFLFEAWAQRHRILTAMLLTSAVFAAVHTVYVLPFTIGLMLNALYVRTGALRATILVHFIANLSSWYPLLGQFIMPSRNEGLGSWPLHLACLVLYSVFVVTYSSSVGRKHRNETAIADPRRK